MKQWKKSYRSLESNSRNKRVYKLGLFFIILILCSIQPVLASTPYIVGNWDRTDGPDHYTIYTNGTTQTRISGQVFSGRWVQESQYRFTIYWNFGPPFIDYVVVAADGQSYSGKNNEGYSFHTVRIGDSGVQTAGTVIMTESITTVKIPTTITKEEPSKTLPTGITKTSSEDIPKNPGFGSIFDTLILIVIGAALIGAGFFLSSQWKDRHNSSDLKIDNTIKNKTGDWTTREFNRIAHISPQTHHDIFISYSHEDKAVADAICATMESHSIRCWIAPRDVLPGENYPAAIINAIEQCQIMVLVYSSKSNTSDHVIRELTKAVSSGAIIIPFRIEDIPLSKDMEYLIGIPHWLDALTPPLEQHIDRLVITIKVLLTKTKKE